MRNKGKRDKWSEAAILINAYASSLHESSPLEARSFHSGGDCANEKLAFRTVHCMNVETNECDEKDTYSIDWYSRLQDTSESPCKRELT